MHMYCSVCVLRGCAYAHEALYAHEVQGEELMAREIKPQLTAMITKAKAEVMAAEWVWLFCGLGVRLDRAKRAMRST